MNKTLPCGLGALAALAFAGAGLAHHSTAMFDSAKVVEVHGVVKEFQYTNPHAWLIVDATLEDGAVATWAFEADGPGTLMRSGIGRNTFPVGMQVIVHGNPMKDGRTAGAWVDTVMEDGSILTQRGPTDEAAEPTEPAIGVPVRQGADATAE